MALIRFGSGVAEMRGSINGVTYSRSRAGAIARSRTVPINPSTTLQSDARERMQLATDAFKDLSKPGVDAWSELAATQLRTNRLGETYVPSGKQLFTEASLNLQLIGGAADDPSIASATADPNLPGVIVSGITADQVAGNLTALDFDAEYSVQTTHLVVQVTSPLPPSVRNAQRYFRQLAVEVANPSVDLTAAYNAAFPDLVGSYASLVGQVIHLRIRGINSGSGFGGAWVYGSIAIATGV